MTRLIYPRLYLGERIRITGGQVQEQEDQDPKPHRALGCMDQGQLGHAVIKLQASSSIWLIQPGFARKWLMVEIGYEA